jgi:cation diffusion facilitator CzcD-associated flavoprotein CzcO
MEHCKSQCSYHRYFGNETVSTQKIIDFDVDALEQKYQEERAKRLRTDAVDQYVELEGRFADFDKDPHADPAFKRDAIVEDLDVLIIGGGFAGLMSGVELRKRGVANLRIVEKGADVGGTWYWNRYPGAACDIESYIYLPMLEELDYMPTERYARAPEIFGHCQNIAKKFDLYRGALFQTEVTSTAWDEKRQRWLITTDRGDRIAARFLVSCTGLLSKPKLPGIPGIESFEGHAFHTSRWDYAYTGGSETDTRLTGLADKVVGIIGTGSTGIQAIPPLGVSAKQLYVFQRTPSSIDFRGNHPTDPEWVKTLKPGWQAERIANFDAITLGGNADVDLVKDGWTYIMTVDATGAVPKDPQRAEMAKMEATRRRIDQIVKDPATAEALKPWYHYFCKRPCFHDDYLPTFNRPNVTLVDTKGRGVERITPKGVVVEGKEYPLDCLIFATGFDWLSEYGKQAGLDPIGKRGIRLSEHWADGFRTLYGMQTHGFPNFFLMSLIQSSTSFNYLTIVDIQTKHIAYAIAECLKRDVGEIQPTQEAEDAWVNEVLKSAGDRRAFLEACTPGYYNFEGKRSKAVELNDFYGGSVWLYADLVEDFRAQGELPLSDTAPWVDAV